MDEMQSLLIKLLAQHSVREEMCLPILLMVGKNEEKIMDLMEYIISENPTESQIVDMALALDKE